jgi:hypothetical protein
MSETTVLLAAIAVAVLSASTDVSLAQYNGPPIILQTPQLPQQLNTDNLKPPAGVTLPTAPAAARPCSANTKC